MSVQISWCLRTADGRDFGSDDAGEAIVSASLIKLPILVAGLRRVDGGHLRLTEELRISAHNRVGGTGWLTADGRESADAGTLLRAMIDASDNCATNVLLDLLGYRECNDAAAAVGMRDTVVARHMMDAAAREAGRENLISASDACACLLAIGGDLLSPASREFALAALRGQTLPGCLDSAVPDGLVLGHKTGELNGVRHDAGILFDGAGPVAVVAMLGRCVPGEEAALIATERGEAVDIMSRHLHC